MILPLRPCVVAVIKNENAEYLVGERRGMAGAWQFPQGGIDDGESPDVAVLRELEEEVGCDQVTIITQSQGEVAYLFPKEMQAPIAKNYSGQSQTWFLCTFKAGYGPDINKADGEFSRLAWQPLEQILEAVVDWKRPAYLEGLRQLGVVTDA